MKTVTTTLIILLLVSSALYADTTQPPPVPSQEQPEVLTSGPVHEAFAEPVNLQDQPGLVAPVQPPAAIQENPPTQKPQGDFVWVPGYWAWDSERTSYIWVSACWRAAPPNMYWVPGYWLQVSNGWQWVSGFWAPVGTQQLEYLPTPPDITEVQPQIPPPTPDSIWVSSCYYWHNGHYIIRAGYWLQERQGWVWVPSHYTWTPRGYVFVQGHWDFALESRGVLFAPVYFPHHFYERAYFSFSPSIVIDIGALQVNLFTYPRYSHYYFGDYYDNVYIGIGIFPCFEVERIHTWYDPIYVYDRWQHRHSEPRWEEHQRHEYDLRRADKDLRPSRTYREMEGRESRLSEPQRKNLRIAEPMNSIAERKNASFKFEKIGASEQKKIAVQQTNVREYRQKRSVWESESAPKKDVRQAENKTPVTPRTERKESVTPQPQNVPQSQPQHRQVRATESEKVSIPKSPVASKKPPFWGSRQPSPPSRPADEQKHIGDSVEKNKDRNR